MADKATSVAAIVNGIAALNGPIHEDTVAAPAHADTTTAQAQQNISTTKKKYDRPRVALPDPIPEEPVKRYPEPSRQDLQDKINAIDAKVQECFDKLKASKVFFDQRSKIRDDSKPAFEKAKAAMIQSNEALKLLFDKKKDITVKIKIIKDAEQGIASSSAGAAGDAGGSKDVQAALRGCRTIEDVDARITELEERQMSSSISLQEEKRLVAQISYLNSKGREVIESKDKAYKDEKALKEKRAAERKELEDQRKVLDAQIDTAKAIVDAHRASVDRLRAEQEEQIRAIADQNKDFDRDAERNKISEHKNEIKALRDDFHKEHDKWFLNERIYVEQQKIAKRKRWEAAQAEREAKRLAWEAEQAQYPLADPYQPEKDMCNALIFHLQNLLGEPTERTKVVKAESTTSSLLPTATVKPTLKKDSKSSSDTRAISKASGKTIGKSVNQEISAFENDAYGAYATKSSKKNRRGRKSDVGLETGGAGSSPTGLATSTDGVPAEDDTKLKPHSLDHLQSFENLGIKPPTRRSELRSTLEQVQEKKEYYDKNPPPKEETIGNSNESGDGHQSKVSGTIHQQHQSRKTSANVSVPDGAAAFPGLGSSAAEPIVSAPARAVEGEGIGRPSFSDIARGHARAPELHLSSFEPPLSSTVANGSTKSDGFDASDGSSEAADVGSAGAIAGSSVSSSLSSGVAAAVEN